MLSYVLLKRLRVQQIQVNQELKAFVLLDDLISFNLQEKFVVLVYIARKQNSALLRHLELGEMNSEYFYHPFCQVK